MKTILTIEIESKDDLKVNDEEGEGQADISKDFHEEVIKIIENSIKDLKDNFPDGIEEFYIEGYDDMKDYGLSIKIKKGDLKNG